MEQTTQSHSATPSVHHQAKARVYSDEEWEAQKSNFERLYKEKPLKDVITTMKDDHGFVATERQYKRRIEKWGLQKNIRGDEMLAIAAQQVKRKLETGKESNFSVRGREVREDKIKRYVKRKKVHDSDLLSHEMPAEAPINEIVCHTPPREISYCAQSEPIKSLTQYESDREDLIIQSTDHMQNNHDKTDLLKSSVISEDAVPVIYSPIPIRSKAQSSVINRFQRSITHSFPSSFLADIGSVEKEITPSPSPSLSDCASEALAAVSPLLNPSLVSPSPPSSALLENTSLRVFGFSDNFSNDILNNTEQETTNFGSHLTRAVLSPDNHLSDQEISAIPDADERLIANPNFYALNDFHRDFDPTLSKRAADQYLQMTMERYRRSLKIYEVRLGPAHPTVAREALRLAICKIFVGQYISASRLLCSVADAQRAMIQRRFGNRAQTLNQLYELFRTNDTFSVWTKISDCLPEIGFSLGISSIQSLGKRVSMLWRVLEVIFHLVMLKLVVVSTTVHLEFERLCGDDRTVMENGNDEKSLDSISLTSGELGISLLVVALLENGC